MSLASTLADRRDNLPTRLGSAELRELDAEILRQSLFSARMTNADAVQELRGAVRAFLTGADNLAEVRLKLKIIGQHLSYDPATGFPGEGPVPPAEAGELRDLFSTDRLNLIMRTQQDMAQGAARNIWGNEPDALEEYPAWELVRVAAVETPRGVERRKAGLIQVPENAWDSANGRWAAACEDAGDEEAQQIFEATGRMVARKDSSVWQSLGDGSGEYEDTLGNDYEPFAFNSGMGRVEVSRDEFAALGGNPDGVQAQGTEFGSDEVPVKAGRFDPDILQTLKKGLDSGDLKFRVKLEVVE